MAVELSKPILTLLDQMEDVQILHDLTDEQLYQVAIEESRKESFITMYQELKRLKNG